MVNFSVLVNGSPSGFLAACGLRQGDPMSPLLFIIVREAFSIMLSVATDGDLISLFLWGMEIQV